MLFAIKSTGIYFLNMHSYHCTSGIDWVVQNITAPAKEFYDVRD